jgi:DNA ligase-associated metallophosphoesterase
MFKTKNTYLNFTLLNELFILLPQRAMIRANDNTLIIADVHFGKATHFRRAGIPVSDEVFLNDLNRIDWLIEEYKVKNVLTLGDFFHSIINSEWQRFEKWLNESKIENWSVIPGNHDKNTLGKNTSPKLKFLKEEVIYNGIKYVHEHKEGDIPIISGHIHPGVSLKGNGKQKLIIPCFHFSKNHLLLPAFGSFTGLSTINLIKGDRVFGIIDDSIIEIPIKTK